MGGRRERHAQRSIALVLLLAAGAAAAPARYFVTPLELPGSSATITGTALNDHGQVVGQSTFTGTPFYRTQQMALWSPSTPAAPTQLSAQPLPMPAEATEFSGPGATDLTNNGAIVAQFTAQGSTTASMWTWSPNASQAAGGAWTHVPPSSGSFSWRMSAKINDAGVVLSSPGSLSPLTPARLVPQPAGGWDTQLLLTGGEATWSDINNAGQVVGRFPYANTAGTHAYVSRPLAEAPTVIDLGSLVPSANWSDATAVNATGQVVGQAQMSSGYMHVIWTPTAPNGDAYTAQTVPRPAGHLSGGVPVAINDSGEFVGTFSDRVLQPMRFVYSPALGYRDLGALLESTSGAGHSLQDLRDINNRGQVLATTRYDADADPSTAPTAHSVLLTPAEAGDANFDFTVNFADLLILAQHYGAATGQTWLTADFTGDGAVNFADLLIVASNYNHHGASASAAGYAMALSATPEPSMLGASSQMLLALRRVRRHDRRACRDAFRGRRDRMLRSWPTPLSRWRSR